MAVSYAGRRAWRGAERCVCVSVQSDVFREGGGRGDAGRCVFRETQRDGTVVRRAMCASSGAERCVCPSVQSDGSIFGERSDACIVEERSDVCVIGRRAMCAP